MSAWARQGRWGWGGEEQREEQREMRASYTGENWAARQSIREETPKQEAGQGGGWEGRMCYGQGEVRRGGTQHGWSYNKAGVK